MDKSDSCAIVRSATESDLLPMARMAAELVQIHHAIDPKRFFLASGIEQGYRNWFARELAEPDAVLLVAELQLPPGEPIPANAEPIGYCYGRIERRNWNMLLDRHAALHDIFVRPEARRTGAATELLKSFALRAKALGAPRIVLSTAHSNQEAQALFKKLGFRPTMIEMTCELDPS